MLLALRQVGRVENRVTHTNPGMHEKSDMRDSDILNYLYSKNKKKRKGDGFQKSHRSSTNAEFHVAYPTFL
jgi:hypothetical protein